MPIKYGDVIKVEYEGTFEDGEIFDSSDRHGGSIKFQVGAMQVLKGFEKAIVGREVGDEINITLPPSEAYGEFNPILVEKIETSSFPADISLEIGRQIDIVGPNGMASLGWISLIEENFVIIDMNHPYAGKTINFKIKILETGLEPDPVLNPFTFGCDNGCEHH